MKSDCSLARVASIMTVFPLARSPSANRNICESSAGQKNSNMTMLFDTERYFPFVSRRNFQKSPPSSFTNAFSHPSAASFELNLADAWDTEFDKDIIQSRFLRLKASAADWKIRKYAAASSEPHMVSVIPENQRMARLSISGHPRTEARPWPSESKSREKSFCQKAFPTSNTTSFPTCLEIDSEFPARVFGSSLETGRTRMMFFLIGNRVITPKSKNGRWIRLPDHAFSEKCNRAFRSLSGACNRCRNSRILFLRL
jgi:hypothetical protein